MRLGYDLTIEQTQKLTMTPELIQAIQILQFNTQELESFVQDELMQNPVLEYDSTESKKEIEVSKTEALDRKEAEDSEIDLREKVKEAEYDDISYKQWEYSRDKDEDYSFEQFVSKEETLEDSLLLQLTFSSLEGEDPDGTGQPPHHLAIGSGKHTTRSEPGRHQDRSRGSLRRDTPLSKEGTQVWRSLFL